MSTRVVLRNRNDPSARVTVTLMAEKSEQYVFRNKAMQEIADRKQPVLPQFPFVTYEAIEGACQSGAFYARRRIKAQALSVSWLDFRIEGRVENVIPFAVATTVGIYEAVAGLRDYEEKELCGWDVADIEQVFE